MSRVYAGRWAKNEATGSTRFQNTLWKKICSDRTSWYVDGLIHSVFAKNQTVSQFLDSNIQIQTIYYYITEVYRLNTLVGSVRYLITLLKYRMFHYIVELYPKILHCWAIPNHDTLLRYTQSYYIAKQYLNTKTLLSYTQS